MKRKLILHIGMHKTGTTAIQNFFERNRQSNLEDYKLYYPRTDRKPLAEEPRHFFLSAAVTQHRLQPKAAASTPSPQQVVKQIAEEIYATPAETALLSTEGLSMPWPEIAEEYAAFSEYFDVEVLAILRRQDLFAESLHSQLIRKQRETRSLIEFINSTDIQRRLDYRSMLAWWEAAFGTRAIHVMLFEEPMLQRGLIESIFDRLSIPILGPLPCRRTNVSPPRDVIELLRHINGCVLTKRSPARRAQLRNRHLMKIISQLEIAGGSTRILGRSERRQLLENHQQGNAEIARRYLGRTDGRLFIDDTDRDCYPNETWTMPEDELADALTRLAATLSASVSIDQRIRAFTFATATLGEAAIAGETQQNQTPGE